MRSIVGGLAIEDGKVRDLLLLLHSLTYEEETHRREALLDAAVRELIPYLGVAHDAMQGAMRRRREELARG